MRGIINLPNLIINTVYPQFCAGCQKSDELLCGDCFTRITLLKKQHCVRCERISSLGRTCLNCRQHSRLDNLFSFAYYEEPLKTAIHQFKYESRLDLTEVLAKIIDQNQIVLEQIASLCTKDAIIIPVPLHRRRLWWRGFNQSELIANTLQQKLNLPVDTKSLRRSLFTVPQMKLRRRGRLHNLDGVFISQPLSNFTIILVDDIVTTGSTLSACAAALKQAGAKRVIGVTVARV